MTIVPATTPQRSEPLDAAEHTHAPNDPTKNAPQQTPRWPLFAVVAGATRLAANLLSLGEVAQDDPDPFAAASRPSAPLRNISTRHGERP